MKPYLELDGNWYFTDERGVWMFHDQERVPFWPSVPLALIALSWKWIMAVRS